MHCAPDDLGGALTLENRKQRVRGDAARAHERCAGEPGPRQQVDHKAQHEPRAEAADGPLEQRLAGRKLKARQALVQHELERCAGDDRPQQHDAELAAREPGGGKITRAHARGRDEQARSEQSEGCFGPAKRHDSDPGLRRRLPYR